MKKIVVIILLFLSNWSVAQELQIFSSGQVDIIRPREKVSNNDTVAELDRCSCYLHKDSTYSGIDTIYGYYYDTLMMSIIEFEEGITKVVSTFRPGEKIICKSHFKNGELHGEIQNYHSEGQLSYNRFYVNGEAIPPGVFYFKSGCVRRINNTSLSNVGWNLEFYENRNLKIMEFLPNPPVDCLKRTYYENGILRYEAVGENGIRSSKIFFENGQIQYQGKDLGFIEEKIGTHKEWYNNGQLKFEIVYNDTIPNQPEGTWSWWNENGKLTKQEMYKKGKLIKQKTY